MLHPVVAHSGSHYLLLPSCLHAQNMCSLHPLNWCACVLSACCIEPYSPLQPQLQGAAAAAHKPKDDHPHLACGVAAEHLLACSSYCCKLKAGYALNAR
jgi:hypothetical protein